MKKKNFLLAAALMTAGCMTAETLPEGLVSLLPEGVKANISTEQYFGNLILNYFNRVDSLITPHPFGQATLARSPHFGA